VKNYCDFAARNARMSSRSSSGVDSKNEQEWRLEMINVCPGEIGNPSRIVKVREVSAMILLAGSVQNAQSDICIPKNLFGLFNQLKNFTIIGFVGAS
jgi:hypothetical protein